MTSLQRNRVTSEGRRRLRTPHHCKFLSVSRPPTSVGRWRVTGWLPQPHPKKFTKKKNLSLSFSSQRGGHPNFPPGARRHVLGIPRAANNATDFRHGVFRLIAPGERAPCHFILSKLLIDCFLGGINPSPK